MNHELPDVQAGFRKGRGTRDQIANICWIIKKAREFQKNVYFCFIDYVNALDCVDHNKLWKILQEMGIPNHLTSLLRNLYTGQEAIVRTGHGTTVWFNSVQLSRSIMSDTLQPMNLSAPGLPVHHQLPESTQTRIHRVSDAFQPSHPLSSPSPRAFNCSQHQSLFQ